MNITAIRILALLTMTISILHAAGAARRAIGAQGDRLVLEALDTAIDLKKKNRSLFESEMPTSRFQPPRRQFGEPMEQAPHIGLGLFKEKFEQTKVRNEALIAQRQEMLESEMQIDAMPTQAERAAAKKQAREDAERYVKLQTRLKQRNLRISFIRAKQAEQEIKKAKESLYKQEL